MEILTLIFFALALNMDAFGAGTAYGIRNIRLPFTSLLIISCMSAAAISVSMLAGNVVSQFVSETTAHRLGGIMLVAVGIWIILQSLQEKQKSRDTEKALMQIHIRPLGLVIQVLQEPIKADLDKSGEISSREALILGLALSMDAFAAGLAVSMLGFPIWLTALIVGTGHLVLTYAGLALGNGVINSIIGKHLGSAIPGLILIILGIFKIYP
ncbi:MAG: sporulation membrane protein YtaF [Clostridiales bacterium]|nr:sporulation membrane protein YtaF [Clostridiales bacterium]MCF8022366.1 sporulation membrane protein YtaF [Clostridiales bacterium]